MELLSATIAKFDTGLVQDDSYLLFVGLVMVIANDESAKCRDMAAELIKGLLTRLEIKQRNVVMSHVHPWSVQQARPELTRVSAQMYGLIIDFLKSDVSPYTSTILEDMNALLRHSALALEAATTTQEMSYENDLAQGWQTPYYALLAFSKILHGQQELVIGDGVDWPSVVTVLLFPHAWVRTAACRLLGTLFAAFPASALRTDSMTIPCGSLRWVSDASGSPCDQPNPGLQRSSRCLLLNCKSSSASKLTPQSSPTSTTASSSRS